MRRKFYLWMFRRGYVKGYILPDIDFVVKDLPEADTKVSDLGLKDWDGKMGVANPPKKERHERA